MTDTYEVRKVPYWLICPGAGPKGHCFTDGGTIAEDMPHMHDPETKLNLCLPCYKRTLA